MIRDYTDTTKAKLLSLLQSASEDNLCEYEDWAEERFPDVREQIDALNLKSDLLKMTEYHKKVIEKNKECASAVEHIFDNVYAVEDSYQSIFADINAQLKECSQRITDLGTFISAESSSFRDVWENKIQESGISKAPVPFSDKELKGKSSITAEDQKELIRMYESGRPEMKRDIDRLLKKLSEEHIRRIKLFVYTAEEPYRSIYLKELQSYRIGNISGKKTGYFSPIRNRINVDMEKEPENPRGPYTTFFHESGHAIDFNRRVFLTEYSRKYRDSQGRSLFEVICQDVRDNVTQVISEYTEDPEIQDHVCRYIMCARSMEESSLSSLERRIYHNVYYEYQKKLSGAAYAAPSDIYGGVTNNLIIGSYGHRAPDGNYRTYCYWYMGGTATGRQNKECWAEFYSYAVPGNERNMNNFIEYLPETYKFLVEMAKSLG